MKKESSTNPLSGKVIAIIVTIIILAIGAFFYFSALDNSSKMTERTREMSSASSQEMSPAFSQEEMNENDNSIPETNFRYQIYGVKTYNFYMKASLKDEQKLFYYYPTNKPLNLPLLEGDIDEYQIHSIGGQEYYPLIIGYEEAKIMRQEGLFSNIGDPINFFGKNMVVVGVMQKTEGILDMSYFIPLNSEELN